MNRYRLYTTGSGSLSAREVLLDPVRHIGYSEWGLLLHDQATGDFIGLRESFLLKKLPDERRT
jgi:hypothetical protein